jgi:hypothetical protein
MSKAVKPSKTKSNAKGKPDKKGTDSERQENFFDICGTCTISCCQGANPPLSPQRRAFIEEQLEKNPVPEVDPPYFAVTQRGDGEYTHFRDDDEEYCIFYNRETKLCRIHTIKGETCVAGPVTFDINRETGKLEFYLKKESICPLAGKMWNTDEGQIVLAKHLEDAKREIRREVAELEPEALKAIMTIEEDETFKIDEEDCDPEVLAKFES